MSEKQKFNCVFIKTRFLSVREMMIITNDTLLLISLLLKQKDRLGFNKVSQIVDFFSLN